jgi:hypothetical protein
LQTKTRIFFTPINMSSIESAQTKNPEGSADAFSNHSGHAPSASLLSGSSGHTDGNEDVPDSTGTGLRNIGRQKKNTSDWEKWRSMKAQ